MMDDTEVVAMAAGVASVGAGVELKVTPASVTAPLPARVLPAVLSPSLPPHPDNRALVPASVDRGNRGAPASICNRRRRDISGCFIHRAPGVDGPAGRGQ